MANAGIPSNIVFIFPGGEGEEEEMIVPRQYPEIEWFYHVAPVVFVGEPDVPIEDRLFFSIENGKVLQDVDSSAYIVDPALYPEQMIAPLKTWLHDLSLNLKGGHAFVNDGREAIGGPYSEEKAREISSDIVIPNTIDEMPKLYQYQITGSCHFLSRDFAVSKAGLSSEEVKKIRQKMNDGVIQLLTSMLDKNLLLKTESISDSPCM